MMLLEHLREPMYTCPTTSTRTTALTDLVGGTNASQDHRLDLRLRHCCTDTRVQSSNLPLEYCLGKALMNHYV